VVEADSPAALGWPGSSELICDQREPDGSVSYQIEAHPRAGYLISGPNYGMHLLSGDGHRLTCAAGPRADTTGWQRLLIAQALPFAALLNGLEVFHASAVIREDRAIALVGPSRAGKTSVALELCRSGAHFMADDVLAMEGVEGRLIAHPGTPVAGLDHADADRLRDSASSEQREVLAVNERERLVRMEGACGPVPLGALFFLERRPDGPSQPRFESTADPQLLLTATFNFVLGTPRRLHALLDVCALAARGRVERILIGPTIDASRLASAIERRLSTLS
jgi:hypothetical protein